MRPWVNKGFGRFLIVAVSGALIAPATAQGVLKPIEIAAPQAVTAPRTLQLEVFINGEDMKVYEAFNYTPSDQRMSVKRRDLDEARIKSPPGDPDELLFLDDLGLKFTYDESNQNIDFALTDEQRLPRLYNVDKPRETPKPHADFGALVNYSLFGGSVRDMNTGRLQFNGANANLDARVFADLGLLEQTGTVGTNLVDTGGTNNFLRLDSTYSFSNPEGPVVYRAGDTISGATSWSRSVHMGGVQISRDFTMRTDVTAQPLPVVSGTAATPSTVDILVNGSKVFTQEVGAGPFSIGNLPLNSSGGGAQVAIRDATGRVTQMSLSLFNTAKMLNEGLSDYSFEGGLARRNYGVVSNDYLVKPIGAGTYRYGLASWLTLEGHAEGGAGLENLGGGAVVGLGGLGTTNVSIAGSHSPFGTGVQGYADWQAQFGRFTFGVGYQRTFSNYDDLASVTADYAFNPTLPQQSVFGVLPSSSSNNAYVSPRPPRELERLSLGLPIIDEKSNLSLAGINLVQPTGQVSRLVTASLTRALPWRNASLFVSGYSDFGTIKSLGVQLGVNIPVWDGISASIGPSWQRGAGLATTASIENPQQQVDDTWGWKAVANGGQTTSGEADLSYRSHYGQASASVTQTRQSTAATGQIDGSVALLGGGVFVGNRTDGSFAVVDAGAPGIAVMQDSRTVGSTDGSGKYLVPNLRSWQANEIGIDASKAPIDYDAARTSDIVAPRAHSGVYLNFGGRTGVAAAIVVLEGADGKPLSVGLTGHLDGAEDKFVVGQGGRAYIKGLRPENVALVDIDEAHQCRAAFQFTPEPGKQSIIRGVTCQ